VADEGFSLDADSRQIWQAFESLLERYPGKKVLIVSHKQVA